jgi:sugar phosphate isomerase/epimerase
VYYLRDALHLAQVVNRPRIRVLADYYHMVKQDEPLEHLLEAGAWIHHAHTSGDHRQFPHPEGYDQRRFLQYLKRAGYGGRLSFECRATEDFDRQARQSVEYVRNLWETVDLRP